MVVFATALRVLEALPFVPKVRDDTGVAETIAFGYPLAERTQYLGINVLRDAEIAFFSSSGNSKTCYWRWDQVPTQDMSNTDTAKKAYEVFTDAINIRRQGDEKVGAFLSGGMDSRAIVAVLNASGATVQTLNFLLMDLKTRHLPARMQSRLAFLFYRLPGNSTPGTVSVWH